MPNLLVVGAGPGISGATARRLGGEGYAVGLIARREEPLARHGEELRAEGIATEWTTAKSGDPASLSTAIARLVDVLGPVDVLLFNVSVGRQATVPELSPDHVTLMAALERLPRAQREAIAMHDLADLPVHEIAATLGVPPGTVKARLSRGRAALADLLSDGPEVPHV